MSKITAKEEFTFDDILLVPGKARYELAEEHKIDISSHITKNIVLKTPIVSANMSTVTESDMAIAIAQKGGIGIIHQFMNEDRQLEEVKKVKKQNLIVGAAVFSFGKTIVDQVRKLAKAGCDVVVIDSANAHNLSALSLIKEIKKKVKVELIVGNIVTKEAVIDVIKSGADGIKVGIGPGSHCTTRIVTGFGRPQLSTISECARAAQKYGIPVMADGGISSSGDVVKALALGANTVMIGGLLAGTKEGPGEIMKRGGKLYKYTWGNCTEEAYGWLSKGRKISRKVKIFTNRILFGKTEANNEAFVEEGVDGFVEYKGEVKQVLNQIIGGVRRGFWYGGANDILELQKKAHFIFVSSSSFQEAQPRIARQ